MTAPASALVSKLNRFFPLNPDELASLAELEVRRRPIAAHTEIVHERRQPKLALQPDRDPPFSKRPFEAGEVTTRVWPSPDVAALTRSIDCFTPPSTRTEP